MLTFRPHFLSMEGDSDGSSLSAVVEAKEMIGTATSNDTIAVVGGLGFIGHQVTRLLLEAGCEVHVIDACKPYESSTECEAAYRKKLEKRLPSVKGATVHTTDILDAEKLCDVIAEASPRTIIHLASIPTAGIALRDPSGTASQMVTGTANLLEAARQNSIQRFLYVSSSMVYGDFEQNPAPESHPKQCQDIYGNLKLASERLAQAYQALHGMECVTVRPMAVYGPTGNEEFVVTKFVRAALEGRPLVINGEETSLDLTFVEDTARGIVLAATQSGSSGGIFNITAGRPRRLTEVADLLSKMIGDVEIEVRDREAHYPKRGGLSIECARARLGYEPAYDLESGLEKMVDAYR